MVFLGLLVDGGHGALKAHLIPERARHDHMTGFLKLISAIQKNFIPAGRHISSAMDA